jgi:transcriptional regulator NrdR family protein
MAARECEVCHEQTPFNELKLSGVLASNNDNLIKVRRVCQGCYLKYGEMDRIVQMNQIMFDFVCIEDGDANE